jgi:hypothetical protein
LGLYQYEVQHLVQFHLLLHLQHHDVSTFVLLLPPYLVYLVFVVWLIEKADSGKKRTGGLV